MTDDTEAEDGSEPVSACESYTWENDECVGGTYIFPLGAAEFCVQGKFVALRIDDRSGDLEGLSGPDAVWQSVGKPARPAAVQSIKPKGNQQ